MRQTHREQSRQTAGAWGWEDGRIEQKRRKKGLVGMACSVAIVEEVVEGIEGIKNDGKLTLNKKYNKNKCKKKKKTISEDINALWELHLTNIFTSVFFYSMIEHRLMIVFGKAKNIHNVNSIVLEMNMTKGLKKGN